MKHPGLLIPKEIQAVLTSGQKVLILINDSGGKDSAIMLDLLSREYRGRYPIQIIWCDTGQEYRQTEDWPDAESWVRQRAARYGYPIAVVRHPKETYYQRVEKKGKFPAEGLRWCTSEWKTAQVDKWITACEFDIVINCLGLRAAESRERAKRLPARIIHEVRKAKNTGLPRTTWEWLPIHHWSTKDVWQYHKTHNIPLHPAYRFLTRYSCQVCIFNSPRDLAAIRHYNPAAFVETADLEQRIQFTMKRDGYVDEIADKYVAANGIPPPFDPYHEHGDGDGDDDNYYQPCLF